MCEYKSLYEHPRGRGGVIGTYHVDVNMADFLVGQLAVVLQDVVVVGAGGDGDLLCDGLHKRCMCQLVRTYIFVILIRRSPLGNGKWGSTYQELRQAVVWDVRQLLAVVLGDDELQQQCGQSANHNKLAGQVRQVPSRRTATYGVALAQRLNVQEGQCLVALKELEGGDFSCDYSRGLWLLAAGVPRLTRGAPSRSSSSS